MHVCVSVCVGAYVEIEKKDREISEGVQETRVRESVRANREGMCDHVRRSSRSE
jgi:hypothetical protein